VSVARVRRATARGACSTAMTRSSLCTHCANSVGAWPQSVTSVPAPMVSLKVFHKCRYRVALALPETDPWGKRARVVSTSHTSHTG